MISAAGLVKKVLDVKELTLWCPSSPGMKVKVKRSRFGRFMKPEYFATLSESIKYSDKLMKYEPEH